MELLERKMTNYSKRTDGIFRDLFEFSFVNLNAHQTKISHERRTNSLSIKIVRRREDTPYRFSYLVTFTIIPERK